MRAWTLVRGSSIPVVAVALAACGGGGSTEAKTVTATVTVTASPTAAQSGVTWKYLQTQYGAYIARTCDDQTMEGSLYNACIGLQNAGLNSFERDATELPPSKSRADLLDSIDRFRASYKDFGDKYCAINPKTIDCITMPYLLESPFGLFKTIVDREAANG